MLESQQHRNVTCLCA